MVAQSIASTSSPQRETHIRVSRSSSFNLLRKWLVIAFFLGKYSQIAILDGMCLIIYLTILHKFRPICVPFQIATTYAPSLKYRFRLTLILKCFRKFQEFFLTHVTFFFGVLKFHQYPFQAQFGIFVIRSLSLLVLSRELKQFGCIVY